MGLDFALNQLVSLTSTFLLNFTDIDTGRRTGTNVMPELTFGGMVETRVAMGCSFSLGQGLGTFDVLDLDTPLLLASDPVTGGYRYEGSRLRPWSETGLDMKASPSLNATTIE
ncbi:MAG: dipeptide epimerase [Nitrospira sp.]|nr:MAG: dipeptide epimerase [Nitrospira sp.]